MERGSPRGRRALLALCSALLLLAASARSAWAAPVEDGTLLLLLLSVSLSGPFSSRRPSSIDCSAPDARLAAATARPLAWGRVVLMHLSVRVRIWGEIDGFPLPLHQISPPDGMGFVPCPLFILAMPRV